MSGYWDFAKLEGSSNYSTWVTDAQSVLILQDLWSVVENDAMTEAEKAMETTTSSMSQDRWDQQVHILQKQRCQKAWAMINLIVEPAVREHYTNIKNPFKVWEKLRDLFAMPDWMARDQILKVLGTLNSSKYDNLYDYAREIKRYKNKMIDLGAVVPDWNYLSFFRQGLEARYKAVIYDVELSVIAAGNEPDIDKLTNALVEHDRSKRQINTQA